MEAFFKIIDNVNEWVGRIFSWLIIPLVAIVVVEILLRNLFNSPTTWSFEVSKQVYGLYFMICAGYTLKHQGHVAIDVFSQSFSPKTQNIVEVICYLLFFFPFCLVLLYYGAIFAAKSWQMLETGWGVFAIPLYPIKTIIPITALLLLLQGAASFIRKLASIVSGGNNV
ncbi:MAG: TRAP transporter small permease subunit [Desulfobacteraceae bacterium]|nr:MAG: TRAP transporter small permease subunit [Desulfobacteraceae bacterium]